MHTAPLAILLLTFIVGIHSTHFRGGSLYWSVPAGSTVANFQVTTFWASSQVQNTLTFAIDLKATPTAPDNIVYQTYTFPYQTIGINQYAAVTGNFSYKFPSNGVFSVWYGDCCWLSTLRAGSGLPFRLTAAVVVDGTYRSSPVVSVPPILTLGVGANSIPITVSEPISTVTFTPPVESGLFCDPSATPGCVVSYSKLGQPLSSSVSASSPAVVVIPTGFKLVWSTTPADVGMWAVSVKVSTVNGYTAAAFLVNIVNTAISSNAPTLSLPNPNQYGITVGNTASFSVSCTTTSSANLALIVVVGYPGLLVGGSSANMINVTSGQSVPVTYAPVLNYAGGNQAYIITFICVNLNTYTYTNPGTVTVYVGFPLVVVPPPTVHLSCHPACGCLDPSTLGYPNVTDGCCGTPTITYTDVGPSGSCDPYDFSAVVITRTWTVVNKCGQSASKTQLIVIKDNIPPIIDPTSVPDQNVQCEYDADDLLNYPATATDTCTDVVINSTDSAGYNQCDNIIKRKWVATDACDNSDTYIQTITVQDTTAPYLTINTEQALIVECPAQKSFFDNIVSAYDNCYDDNTLTFTDDVTVDCGKFTRTWIGTDPCNNSASYSLLLEVTHTELPVITPNNSYAPPQCISDVDCLPTPTAKSYCGKALTVTKRQNSSYSDTYGCYTGATRYWTVIDECGNIANYDEPIDVTDTTKPYWTCFTDNITVECDYTKTLQTDYTPDVVGGYPQAADNCQQNVTVSYSDDFHVVACRSYILRTWTARDTCGNFVTRVQTIFVVDTTPPTGTIPCDQEIQCLSQLTLLLGATVGVDCNSATVTSTDTIIYQSYLPNCGDRKIRRTFNFSDICGNSETQSMIITIADTIPPTIGELCNSTADCRIKASPNQTGYATGEDNCGQPVSVTYDDGTTYGAYLSFIDRYWTVTDTCGNSAHKTQIIKLNNTKPFLDCPSDTQVPCDSGTGPAYTGYACANDQCTGKLIPTYTDIVTGSCPSQIQRTWTASDDVTKQTGQCIQIIKVGHDDGPHLKLPPDVTVQCKFQATGGATGKACSSKVCTEDTASTPVSSDTESGKPCAAGYHISRLWTTQDSCNHSTSGIQTINIWDTTKPVFCYVPPNYYTTCRFNTSVDACGKARATDNCDKDGYPVTIAYKDSVIPSALICPTVVTREWSATDCTGNVQTAEQYIYITETGPYFPNYDYLQIPQADCDNCLQIPDVHAYDSCGNRLTPTYIVSKSGSCPTLVTITWTAIDSCGRTATLVKTTKVYDTKPPVIDTSKLVTIVVECESDVPVGGLISVSDNCPNVGTPTYIDYVAPTDCACKSCAQTIERVWSVSDACGNIATYNQTIIVEKKKSPVLTTPKNASVACGSSYTADSSGTGAVTAQDSCGTKLQVSYTDKTVTTASGMIVYRSWSATDNCQHTTVVIQQINIDATVSSYSYGYVFNIPPDRYLPCGGNIHDDESTYPSGQQYTDYTNQNCYLTSSCGTMTITWDPLPACPAKPGVWTRNWYANRNGVVVQTKVQNIFVDDCPPRGSGISNIPVTPGSLPTQNSITPYLTVVDLNLPCEIITIVWTWGDGNTDTITCTPTKESDFCTFQGNQLISYYTHAYSTSKAAVYPISALVYGQRHIPLPSYGTNIGSDYIIFVSQYTTVDPYSGTVSGCAQFNYNPEYTYTTTYSCVKPWIVNFPGYGTTSACSGYPRLDLSASFILNNLGKIQATGHTYFTWANCGGADQISFKSDNLLHLSIFADGVSALWIGTGYFGTDATTAYNFTVYAVDGGPSGDDHVHLRVLDGNNNIYLDTDPCMPADLFTQWTVQPTRVPLTALAATANSDITVRNPTDQTVSAITSESGGTASPTPVIVGIVVGLLVFIAIVAVIVGYLLHRKKQLNTTSSQQQQQQPMNM